MRQLVFTGCYSEEIRLGTGEILRARGEGIATYVLEEGRLVRRFVCEARNPTYLALHPNGQILYAVHELKEYLGLPSAAVSAYAIGADGSLALINRRPTLGEDACHLSLSPGGQFLICSNYSGGSVCVFPIEKDFGVGRPSCFFQNYGSGANPLRQGEPHVHHAIPDITGRHVLVSDLGTDEIAVYGVDWSKGHLIPGAPPLRTPPGMGPRQCVWSAAGDRLYVLTEMGSTMCVFRYDAQSGAGELLQTLSILPDGYAMENTAACVKLHPNGRLLFASNRGHDSIAVCRVGEDGLLTLLDIVKTGGGTPRDFDLTPAGDLLIVGNQESDELVVFAVDGESGALREVSRAESGSVTAVMIVER